MEVSILNSNAPLDFGSEKCDLAIVLGNGTWPDAEATLLLEDVVEPVCAPGFTQGAAIVEGLRGKRLLVSRYRKDDWPRWLAHVGAPEVFDAAEKMVFSSSILTWQAAMDGLGIAIGQQYMLDADLQAARLVRPFARPLHTGQGHYIVTPALQRHSDKITAFKDWLMREAGRL